MKRGEVWTVSGGPDYASKPRPAVVVQNDAFSETDSIAVCPSRSDDTDLPLFRVLIGPSEASGQMLEAGRLLSNFLALA